MITTLSKIKGKTILFDVVRCEYRHMSMLEYLKVNSNVDFQFAQINYLNLSEITRCDNTCRMDITRKLH